MWASSALQHQTVVITKAFASKVSTHRLCMYLSKVCHSIACQCFRKSCHVCIGRSCQKPCVLPRLCEYMYNQYRLWMRLYIDHMFICTLSSPYRTTHLHIQLSQTVSADFLLSTDNRYVNRSAILYVKTHLFLYTLFYREGLMLQSPSKSKYHIHTLLSALLSGGLLW